ncbi:hypothetical protein QJS04_geneDACA004463 [Acorus gramineus]|uniref:C2H2-type domain-containing protein n=1 Tax=Acorus gramineus TaxID=55184 RepID=A0AAV9B821_ACOGR|nr:hypothetical protein QJS04_geneDACA004463 [Acorus gramineus]
MDPKEHEIQGGGGGHHHACWRCGWVYPNPHPSAKHRRAHKKHCVNTDGIAIAENRASDDGDGSDGLLKSAVEVFMDSKAGLEESTASESKTNNADDINKQIDLSPGNEIKIQGSSESSTDQLKDTVSVQDCDLVCVTDSVDSYVLDNRSNSLDEGLIKHTDILSHSVIGESHTSCTAGIEFPLDASIRRSNTESGFTNVTVHNMDAEVSDESDLVINSDALAMSSAETSTGVISNLEDMGEIFRKEVSSDPTNKDAVDASLDPNGIDCVTCTSQEVRTDAFIDSVQILGGSIHINPSPETEASNTNALTDSFSSEASTEIGPAVSEDDGSNVPEVSVSHAGGVETKFGLEGHLANQVPSEDQSSFVDIDSDKAANFPPSTKHIEQENCNLAETRSKSTPQKVVVYQALTDENEKGAPLIGVCSDADKVAISAVKINLNGEFRSNQPSDTTIGEPLSTKTAIFDSSMQLGGTDLIKCMLENNSELDGMKSTIKEVIANQTAIDEENMKGTDVEKNDLSVVKTDLIEYIVSDQPEAQLESKAGEPLTAQEALSAEDKSEFISGEQEASHLLPHEDIQETFPCIPSIGLVTSDVDSQSHEAAELDGVNFVDERIGQCLEGVTQEIFSSNPKADPATSSSNEDQETTTMDSGSCNNVQEGTQNEAANVDAQYSREGPMVGSCQPNTINSSQPAYCSTDNLDDGSCNAVLDGNITHHIDSTDSLKMGTSMVENHQLEELNISVPEVDISMEKIQLHEDIEMYKLEKSGEMSKTPSSIITMKGIEIDGVSGEKMSKSCSDEPSNHDVTSQEILVEEAIGVKDASVIKADSKVEQIENENRIAGNNREEHILLEEHIIPAVNVGSLIQSSVTHLEIGNQDVAKGCDSSVSSLPPVEDHGCSDPERHPNGPVAPQDAASDTVNLTDGVEGHGGSISDGGLPSKGDATDTHSIAVPEAQSTSEDIAAPAEDAFLFEAPSFMTLVEPNRGCDIHSKETSQNLTNDSQAPTENNIKDKKKDVEIVPRVSNTSEKSHTPLKSLLLEANVECKLKPSNAKDGTHKNQAVSSPVKSDANSVESGARRVENDWNSPARLPKIKTVEKRKVKGKEGWVPFMCCSYLKS